MTKWDLIKICLKQRCKTDTDWQLSLIEKWLYTFKAVACITLDRWYSGTEWDWYSQDYISVGMHSFQKFYNYEFGQQDASFTTVTVAYGWRNWQCCELSDGWL